MLPVDKTGCLTIDSQIELPCGFACNVAGHTGILASVIKLSHVDL